VVFSSNTLPDQTTHKQPSQKMDAILIKFPKELLGKKISNAINQEKHKKYNENNKDKSKMDKYPKKKRRNRESDFYECPSCRGSDKHNICIV
jgi:hypothetical protein